MVPRRTQQERARVQRDHQGGLERRVQGREAADKLFPTNGCIDPAGTDDPGFNLVQGVGPVAIAGLDLDGADSKAEGGSGCAHDDFIGPDGETGIDNQHWRLMGCVAAYQPGGLIDNLYEANGFVDGNAAPVLIELTGVDNLRNDDDVELRFFSSGDAVTFDARGKALPDATMTAHDDPRFHSKPVAAKIVDGVLTSEPTADLYIKVKTQTMDNEFHYRDARVRAEVAADGSLKGLIGAYWDGDNLYDAMNRQYIGENHVGRIAAITRGYMCAGMYNAIPRIADGHPDPETGKCTSVSHAVHFEAVPAFVVLPQLAKAQP